MQKRMSFNHIATTLATLSAASFVAGDLGAAQASEPISACEVPHAVALGEGDDGDKETDKGSGKEKDKDRGKGDGDADDKNKKKKKGKKEGSCGGHGGCGAGSCG